MNLYQVRLLVIFLYFEATTRLASKAVAEAAINDLSSPPNLPSSRTNSGNRIVQTLEQIVEELKISNQKTEDFSSNFQFLSLLQQQGTRLQTLETQMQECRRNKNEDYQQLVRQVQSLEARLNLTIEENIDLRATIDILHDDLEQNESYESLSSSSPMTNQTTTSRPLHHRQPRNFLSSSASNTLLTSKQKVAFDAYRNQPFDEEQATITYDGTSTNLGNGLNISTGMFTAPIAGAYAFHFHALTRDGTATYIKFMHNGRNVGGAYRRHAGEADENHEESLHEFGLQRAEGMLGQSVVLSLEEKDQISVFAYHGNIRDGGWHYTHFTGYLLF